MQDRENLNRLNSIVYILEAEMNMHQKLEKYFLISLTGRKIGLENNMFLTPSEHHIYKAETIIVFLLKFLHFRMQDIWQLTSKFWIRNGLTSA